MREEAAPGASRHGKFLARLARNLPDTEGSPAALPRPVAPRCPGDSAMSNGPPDTGPGPAVGRATGLTRLRSLLSLAVLLAAGLTCGCTPWQEYVHNGFKVGPNYRKPPAPVAKNWIDADDKRVRTTSDD